jgi:peptidoglycan/LPS O-acetylase OafA/YrhL
MMLACLWRRLIVDRDGLAIWLTPVGAAVWLLVFPFLTQRVFPEDWRRMSSSWLAGISIFVVFTVMKSQVPRMLVWLGALSYGIYLYHPTVSHVVFRFLPSLIHAPHAAFLLTALGAIGLASISYTLIERPCIRFGKSRSNRTPDVRTSLQPTSVGSVS